MLILVVIAAFFSLVSVVSATLLYFATQRRGGSRVAQPSAITSTSATSETRKANMTFFDDAEMMGIKVSAYPLKFQGRDVWPAAVHQRDFSTHMHKVLEVVMGSKTFLVHIADMCISLVDTKLLYLDRM
jgi:uncharacterized membrane protein